MQQTVVLDRECREVRIGNEVRRRVPGPQQFLKDWPVLLGRMHDAHAGLFEPALHAFDRFWRWLKRHPNCILRAGTSDAYLYDQEDLHWHLEEDEDRTPTIQVLAGKQLLGEILIEAREVMFVQAMPDPDGDQGQFLFELVGGSGEQPYDAYHVVVAHGFDEEAQHRPQLKQ